MRGRNRSVECDFMAIAEQLKILECFDRTYKRTPNGCTFMNPDGDILRTKYLLDTEGHIVGLEQYCNDKYVSTVKVKHMSEDKE